MNCGLKILFGGMKKNSEKQYKANAEGEWVTNHYIILQPEESITIDPSLELRKTPEEEGVQGIAHGVW